MDRLIVEPIPHTRPSGHVLRPNPPTNSQHHTLQPGRSGAAQAHLIQLESFDNLSEDCLAVGAGLAGLVRLPDGVQCQLCNSSSTETTQQCTARTSDTLTRGMQLGTARAPDERTIGVKTAKIMIPITRESGGPNLCMRLRREVLRSSMHTQKLGRRTAAPAALTPQHPVHKPQSMPHFSPHSTK